MENGAEMVSNAAEAGNADGRTSRRTPLLPPNLAHPSSPSPRLLCARFQIQDSSSTVGKSHVWPRRRVPRLSRKPRQVQETRNKNGGGGGGRRARKKGCAHERDTRSPKTARNQTVLKRIEEETEGKKNSEQRETWLTFAVILVAVTCSSPVGGR